MVADKIYDLLPDVAQKSIGDLPSSPINTVAIIEYDGARSTEYFGMQTDAISIFQPIVKIVVRNLSYETGELLVEEIKEKLHRYHDDFFLSILAVGSPIYLGRDTQKAHEFQVTFRTNVKE